MNQKHLNWLIIIVPIALVVFFPMVSVTQALKTPLKQEVLDILANEVSGQMIYNNEVMLAGAPWIRERDEFTDTFYESGKIYEIARSYGIETVELQRHAGEGTYDYPFEGEFWITEPEKRLVARLGADAALVARGSKTVDVTGELIYIPSMTKEEIDSMMVRGEQEEYKGKIALMWSHVWGNMARALDSAGVRGVVSFSSRDRYMDPNQVVYGRGFYGRGKNLDFGFSVSWRQWSELLEDIESGKKMVVQCKTLVETFPNKYETVFAWIPGTEPDKKGVVFTGHLFEGYTKRGANDNMSGCVIQLEILRALTKLIEEGTLPRPRRTMYFIWPDEIGGMYEFIKQNNDLIEKWSINMNMDMVGEALRMNNAVLNMSETPSHLPSYFNGLAKSILNYVWRTNDIVYLPDSPRGRRGGQYFPKPMLEKNGTIDAFRFFVHRATGGSDHICFNNPSVAVPGVEFGTWPDQWYHADTDLPDKSDPTQMKRMAFIGAACAWVITHCSDDVLDGLLDAVSEFGYHRIAERHHPKALHYIESASADNLDSALAKALNLIDFSLEQEMGAIRSIEDIYTASKSAKAKLKDRIRQWELYEKSLVSQVSEYAAVKAKRLGAEAPKMPTPGRLEKTYDRIVPDIHKDVKGKDFYVRRSELFKTYMEEHPDFKKDFDLSRIQERTLLDFVNGGRSITKIWKWTMAETGTAMSLDDVAAYMKLLKDIGWIDY